MLSSCSVRKTAASAPRRAEEAEAERRVVQQRPAARGLPSTVVAGRVGGPGRRPAPAWRPPRRLVRRAPRPAWRACRSGLVLGEARDDVAQLAPSWATMPSRRLADPVDLGLHARRARGRPRRGRSTRSSSAWVCADDDDLLGLAAGPAEQRLGLGLRPAGGASVAWLDRLAGPLLGGRRRGPRPPRPGGRSRRWRWCGGRRPRGSAAPSPPPACAGPPAPRGRRPHAPARPRAWRRRAARWPPAGRPAGAGRPRARGGQDVLGLGPGQRALLLGVGRGAGAGLVELLELDHAHVVGLAAGVARGSPRRPSRPARGSRRRPDRGLSRHLVGLLLGEPQHRRARPPRPAYVGRSCSASARARRRARPRAAVSRWRCAARSGAELGGALVRELARRARRRSPCRSRHGGTDGKPGAAPVGRPAPAPVRLPRSWWGGRWRRGCRRVGTVAGRAGAAAGITLVASSRWRRLAVVEDGQARRRRLAPHGWHPCPGDPSQVPKSHTSRGHAAGRLTRPRNRLIVDDAALAHLLVAHAEALLRRQAEHADLALVEVAVHVVARPGRRRPAGTSCDSVGWIMPLAISRLASHASR